MEGQWLGAWWLIVDWRIRRSGFLSGDDDCCNVEDDGTDRDDEHVEDEEEEDARC